MAPIMRGAMAQFFCQRRQRRTRHVSRSSSRDTGTRASGRGHKRKRAPTETVAASATPSTTANTSTDTSANANASASTSGTDSTAVAPTERASATLPSMDDDASATVVASITEPHTRRPSLPTTDAPAPTHATANATAQTRNGPTEPAAAATADASVPRAKPDQLDDTHHIRIPRYRGTAVPPVRQAAPGKIIRDEMTQIYNHGNNPEQTHAKSIC